MAAFSDHLAVVLRIALDVDTIRRGTGYWKMNMALLQDILSEKSTTTMGTLETAEEILSRHGDVVGEGKKNKSVYFSYVKARRIVRTTQRWKISNLHVYMIC